jgi:hypothetical protein
MSASRTAGLILAAVLLSAAPADGQILIKANDDVTFRLGALVQFQADWLEDPAADDTQQNLFIRRARVLFGGQVAKKVTFFIETDAPNLGKTVSGDKNISGDLIVQDAYGEFAFTNAFALDFGLMFVPFGRNNVQAAGTLLPIDYGSYTYTISAPTESLTGRDTGVQAKGYLLENRLEYRLGVFQGARDAGSHRSFRYTGRAQYQLLDPETPGFFYTGTYLGAKKVAAVGAAFDTQDEYLAFDADAFADLPLGPGALTSLLMVQHLDGDTTFTTLPKQNTVLLEVGYFLREWRISPVLQLTRRDLSDGIDGDEDRWSIGLNYWWVRHNANIKAAYGRIEPKTFASQNQFTVQLQLFYY